MFVADAAGNNARLPFFSLPSSADGGSEARAINISGAVAGKSGSSPATWLPQSAYDPPAGVHNLTANSGYSQSAGYGLNSAPNGILSVVGWIGDGVSIQAPFPWRSDSQQSIDLNSITTGVPTGMMQSPRSAAFHHSAM